MKKLLFACFGATLLIISCGKDDPAPNNPAGDPFMTLTAGSTFTYKDVDNIASTSNTYTITSTNQDSSVGSRSYHVFTNSTDGSSDYYNISGNSYFRFAGVAGLSDPLELEYLRDNVAAAGTWAQDIAIDFQGVPLNAHVTNTVEEKGGTLTVNGTAYTNLIKVKTDISIAGLPASALVTNIHSYYAPKYGNVRTDAAITIDYMGFNQETNITTTLESSNIQ